jgi:hypothetical protein
MRNILDQTLQTRKALYVILKNTPREELLKIPEGFNNNIWWNIAHIVATQQSLMYRLSGVQTKMDNDLINKFKKGTVPDGTATDEEIDRVKKLIFTTVEDAIVDYENGVFAQFKEYTTSANVTLKNIDDAISFNLYHEGLHLGSILALMRAIRR